MTPTLRTFPPVCSIPPKRTGTPRPEPPVWTGTASRPRCCIPTSPSSTPTRCRIPVRNAQLQIACAQAYNDYQTDYAAEAPGRFVPITTLPFFDLDASLAEIKRCADLGHKGIGFSQEPNYYGLPYLVSDHWDPLWALAQDMGLSINFHIAPPVGGFDFAAQGRIMGKHAVYGSVGASSFMSNCHTLSQSDLRRYLPPLSRPQVRVRGERYRVDARSPSSIVGLAVEELRVGHHEEHPEYELLPSEYFVRQIYGCFWFEDGDWR